MEKNRIRKFNNAAFFDSAKQNGYTSTDTAICEIIDNSVESYDEIANKNGLIEIITIEARGSNGREKIVEIIVADAAGGMSEEVLQKALAMGQGTKSDVATTKSNRKLGKFGMGLLNSSISQCDRVEVYSWQKKDELFMSYEDLEEYRNSDEANESQWVNFPQKVKLPTYLSKLVSKEIQESNHGTIVSWKKMTGNTWKTRVGFLNNVEFELGRIFRHMISDESIRLILKPCTKISENQFEFHDEIKIKPNDPLQVMGDLCLKKPWNVPNVFKLQNTKPMKFDVDYEIMQKGELKKISSSLYITFSFCEKRISEYKDKEGFSYLRDSIRGRNQGLSVVREGREIELNKSWLKSSDPRDRWVAGEIIFDSSLDHFMGIDNQKQMCSNFKYRDVVDLAASYDLPQADYLKQIREGDTELAIHLELSRLIDNETNRLTKMIRDQGDGTGTKRKTTTAEAKAAEAIRAKKAGKTQGDIDFENSSDEEKKTDLVVTNNQRFVFRSASSTSLALFDVVEVRGINTIILNQNHPGYKDFYQILESKSNDSEEYEKEFTGIKLLFAAWARLENQSEIDSDERYQLQKYRSSWGDLIRIFLKQEVKEDSNKIIE